MRRLKAEIALYAPPPPISKRATPTKKSSSMSSRQRRVVDFAGGREPDVRDFAGAGSSRRPRCRRVVSHSRRSECYTWGGAGFVESADLRGSGYQGVGGSSYQGLAGGSTAQGIVEGGAAEAAAAAVQDTASKIAQLTRRWSPAQKAALGEKVSGGYARAASSGGDGFSRAAAGSGGAEYASSGGRSRRTRAPSKWNAHVSHFQKTHPDMAFADVLRAAAKTYKK